MVSNLVSNALESHAQVFPTLTEAQINRVRPFASLRQVKRGDVLFSADDSDVPFFILLSGSMEIVQPDMNGERLVASHGPGEFTGEMTMITGHHSLVCGRMTDLGEVLEMSGSGLRSLVARDGELSEIFMRAFILRRLILIATAPEGGEDIMHMDKPELRKITEDPNMPGLEKLVKLFFAPSESSQAAGEAFATRLAERKQDGEPLAGQDAAIAQITAFRAWEKYSGERFAKLGKITQPCLVVNGVFDNMIPVRNSYMLSEHLPNAMLLTYPDAGHGSLFQFHKSFVRQASLFLDSEGIS